MNYTDTIRYPKAYSFLKSEILPVSLLLIATIMGLIMANTSLEQTYNYLFHQVNILPNMNLNAFINDLLMAVFFLVIGCEIKKEIVSGTLSKLKQAAFPVVAAIGGILVPALLYFLLNMNSGFLSGLGVPISTDIAFAMGVFLIFKSKLNDSLRIFLLTVAIVDDLIAIAVIGIFYSNGIAFLPLLISAGIFILLLNLKRFDITNNLIFYCILGLSLWYFIYISGVNPTISGVLVAFALPITKPTNSQKESMLSRVETRVSPYANLIILPLFALSNTAITLNVGGIPSGSITVTLGIILGLVVGKPLGIMLFTSIGSKLKLIEKPSDISWSSLCSVGMLAGIGFTMSIFVAEIAFASNLEMLNLVKISILAASMITCLIASIVINYNGRSLEHAIEN